MRGYVGALFAAGLLAGCADGRENVLFVTSTQLDIGYDATIPNVNFGYDRNELMIGPAYVDTGGLPPVAAALRSNLSIFEPKVSQVYATGNAAVIATGEGETTAAQIDESCAAPPAPAGKWVGCSGNLTGQREVAMFGTSSNFGLKVGYDATGATTVSLGYKRREVSVIPLKPEAGRDPSKPDDYPSVIGSIEIDNTIDNPQGTKSELAQFFATGRAAEQLATRGMVRGAFGVIADQAAQTRQLNAENAAGQAVRQAAVSRVGTVVGCVQSSAGSFGSEARSRLAALVAIAGLSDPARSALLATSDPAGLTQTMTDRYDNAIDPMYAAATGGAVACDR